jgi:hypothetical protein
LFSYQSEPFLLLPLPTLAVQDYIYSWESFGLIGIQLSEIYKENFNWTYSISGIVSLYQSEPFLLLPLPTLAVQDYIYSWSNFIVCLIGPINEVKRFQICKCTAYYQHDFCNEYFNFQEVMSRFHPVFRHFFLEKFPDPSLWFEKRLAYTRSVATASIGTFPVASKLDKLRTWSKINLHFCHQELPKF